MNFFKKAQQKLEIIYYECGNWSCEKNQYASRGKHSNKKEMHLRNDETDGIKKVGVKEKQ